MRVAVFSLILSYGIISAIVFVKWYAIFRKDHVAYTEDRPFSTFVLIVAALFWVLTVPIAWIERRKRLSTSSTSNLSNEDK
jgi:hypothetical protein